ncbi:MAG: YjfB family protein [Negativicutes bacterium]|nr:YjfB family protein [Negativicutes bacterium]
MDKVTLSSVVAKAPNDIVGLMVMKKAMNTAKQDGQNMVNLIASTLPHLGKNIDIKI